MSTYIKTLKDKLGNVVLPRTRTTAITMGDGTTTLEQALALKASTSHKSTHATGGSDALTPADIGAASIPIYSATQTSFGTNTVTETMDDGGVLVTTFNADGTITAVLTKNSIAHTKTTTFNGDGTISEVIS